MVVHIISADSIVVYQAQDDRFGERYTLRIAELKCVRYADGREFPKNLSAPELAAMSELTRRTIFYSRFGYRLNGEQLTEREMLDSVAAHTSDKRLLTIVHRTRTFTYAQRTFLIGGGVVSTIGLIIAVTLGHEPDTGYEFAGIIGLALSIPVEILAAVPYIFKKVCAARVVKRYNAEVSGLKRN